MSLSRIEANVSASLQAAAFSLVAAWILGGRPPDGPASFRPCFVFGFAYLASVVPWLDCGAYVKGHGAWFHPFLC